METDRIAELLSPFTQLTKAQLQSTLIYIDLLQKWNARINLTAIRGPEEMVTRHFGESYFAAGALLTDEWTGKVIDLGSGAGFPGLPMAIFRPKVQITLIEANGKKGTFLREVAAHLGLRNVTIWNGRGEDATMKAELVVMRAVERFEMTLEVAAKLVTPGGRLGLLIGAGQVELAKSSESLITWDDLIPIPQSQGRVLFVGKL